MSEIYDTEADKINAKFIKGLKSKVMSELNARSRLRRTVNSDRKKGKIFPGWHFTKAEIQADTERCQDM